MVWGLNQIGMGTILLLFVSSPKTVYILGYTVSTTVQFMCIYTCIQMYNQPFTIPLYYYLLPYFSFSRVYYYISKNCLENRCYQSLSEVQGEARTALLFFIATGVVYPAIGIWLNHLVFSNAAKTRSPRRPSRSLNDSIVSLDQSSIQDDSSDKTGVITEEEYINKLVDVKTHPIVVEGISKKYYKDGVPFQALHPTYFHIAKGEVLGLLGPNGAGKTTLISILTGQILPQSGNAWIGGNHIIHNLPNIYKNIGVCPQFDLFWEDLTVTEHLLFYLRLKGCESSDEIAHVNEVCTQVELFEHKDKLAKELSGGMKRRLSLAIAMIGDPQVIFLDEPTTGLDPLNREIFWKILERVKRDKSIILTTHLMQEADNLSDRIGSRYLLSNHT